jgi:hypothetical protein
VILSFVFRNGLLIVLVSGPKQVKVAHFSFSFCGFCVVCKEFMGNLSVCL